MQDVDRNSKGFPVCLALAAVKQATRNRKFPGSEGSLVRSDSTHATFLPVYQIGKVEKNKSIYSCHVIAAVGKLFNDL